MGQENTFFTAIKSRVAAVMNGGSVAFPRVFITNSVNLEELVKVPRFPVAVISPDEGATINATNGKILNGEFHITIIVMRPRDHIGETATLDLMDLSDLLVTAMEYDNDNSRFNYVSRTSPDTVNLDQATIVARSITFNYMYQRT